MAGKGKVEEKAVEATEVEVEEIAMTAQEKRQKACFDSATALHERGAPGAAMLAVLDEGQRKALITALQDAAQARMLTPLVSSLGRQQKRITVLSNVDGMCWLRLVAIAAWKKQAIKVLEKIGNLGDLADVVQATIEADDRLRLDLDYGKAPLGTPLSIREIGARKGAGQDARGAGAAYLRDARVASPMTSSGSSLSTQSAYDEF